jgi:uncharacterized OB-fold protein
MPACMSCGWQGRPRRVRCPSCGGAAWADAPLPKATVVATTQVRRHLGGVVDPPEIIALVITDDEATFIARFDGATPPKPRDQVTLSFDGGLVAHPLRKSSRARAGAKRKLGP